MKFSITKMSGFGFIVFGITGYLTGALDMNAAVQNVLTGVAIIGGRKAIDKFVLK